MGGFKLSDFVVGITGASGSIYGVRLVEEFLKSGYGVDLVITPTGERVMAEELPGFDLKKDFGKGGARLRIWKSDDYSATFLSGSRAPRAVIIIPCSMGTLGALANGISSNLLERAADVALKEKKQLILVPRETPLNLIHLENMAKLARAGADILPAMPAFYHSPKDIEGLVNFIVGKVFDLLGVEHYLFKRWQT